MKIPIVSIIGRPNVGKSTLFNRIAGKRVAITADEPGTTRDRIFQKVENPDMDFFLVDTGGIQAEAGEATIEKSMRDQSRIAMEESDLILFMVSAREDLTKDDYHVAEMVRSSAGGKPVILVAGKSDSSQDPLKVAHLYELGLGEPLPISAIHNEGIDRLATRIVADLRSRHFLPKSDPGYTKQSEWESTHLKIALVGKPNVGKSSIVNALLNQEKVIVSDVPGTTRDSIDCALKVGDRTYNLIDTAGLRRAKKVERGIEHFSVLRTLSAIDRCDVAVLVLDSSQKVTDQDQQIAHLIASREKGLILLLNKWDIKVNAKMTEEQRQSTFIDYLQKKFGFVKWASVMFTSAKTRRNLPQIFDVADAIRKASERRIPTSQLNSFVEEAKSRHTPTGTGRSAPKLYYMTQVGVTPPRFKLFVNKRKFFHFSFLRYLEARLRERFGYEGSPIVFEFSEKEYRYSKK